MHAILTRMHFMRFFFTLIALGFTLLLAGCDTANYYTPTVQSWRGANINTLTKRWGRPDIIMPGPNNTTLYGYKSTSYHVYQEKASPSIGVNNQGAHPVVVNLPTEASSGRGYHPPLKCTTYFIVDRSGSVIGSQSQGNGCYRSANAARNFSNQ
jgi:hypothetical protein